MYSVKMPGRSWLDVCGGEGKFGCVFEEGVGGVGVGMGYGLAVGRIICGFWS